MNIETFGKIQKFLLVVACIAFLVGLILTKMATDERNHNVADISIRIVDVSSKIKEGYSSSDYYVYMDFEIENNTEAALDSLNVTFYFRDKNGKSVGKLTSSFGGNTPAIKSGKKGIETSYISEYGDKWDSLFYELYHNGLENCSVIYEITGASWDDDYSWYGDY